MTPARGVALVTGAGVRIGRAIAIDLARIGFDVGLHVNRSRGPAEEVAAEIAAFGRRAVIVTADLAEEAAVERLTDEVARTLGPVTCLVNNASLFERDEMPDVTKESWDAHLAVNLRAPFVLIQAMTRALPAGADGLVVNLLDQRVWNLTPHFISYTVSKAGLWTLTQTLALALAPRIRVNAIGPGPTLPSPRQSQAQFQQQCAAMPLGRGTTPEEICAALRLIVEARGMTGQMIALDGGQHLGWTFPPRGSQPDD